MRYVPSKIRIIATNFNTTVFLSISSLKILGKNLLTKIDKNRTTSGVMMLSVEISVIGPSVAE